MRGSSVPRRFPTRDEVTVDTPLRLDVAAGLAFPDGSITASGLRREAEKGRLVVWLIANRMMTSLTEIGRMIERCRVEPKVERPPTSTAPTASAAREAALLSQAALRLKLGRRESDRKATRATRNGVKE